MCVLGKPITSHEGVMITYIPRRDSTNGLCLWMRSCFLGKPAITHRVNVRVQLIPRKVRYSRERGQFWGVLWAYTILRNVSWVHTCRLLGISIIAVPFLQTHQVGACAIVASAHAHSISAQYGRIEVWQDGRMEVRVEQKYGMALLGFRRGECSVPECILANRPTFHGTVPQKAVASRCPAAESRVRPTLRVTAAQGVHIARCACVRCGETWPLSFFHYGR